ncbi:hypothetical protein HY439_01875 [Candidatus Microgenomates bacterium]|nr:hypothetical protein [Candidatus Microgenomates bacterium]
MVLAEKRIRTQIHTAEPFLRELSEQEKLARARLLAKDVIGDRMDPYNAASFRIAYQAYYDIHQPNTHVPELNISRRFLKNLKRRKIVPIHDPSTNGWLLAEASPEAPHLKSTAGQLERRAKKHGFNVLTIEQYRLTDFCQHLITGSHLDEEGKTRSRIASENQTIYIAYFTKDGQLHCRRDYHRGLRDEEIGGRWCYSLQAAA